MWLYKGNTGPPLYHIKSVYSDRKDLLKKANSEIKNNDFLCDFCGRRLGDHCDLTFRTLPILMCPDEQTEENMIFSYNKYLYEHPIKILVDIEANEISSIMDGM